MKTAKEFFKEEYSEHNSMSYYPPSESRIAEIMEEYAKYYHEQQVKSVDLANVGGSYTRKDMADAWLAGCHRRADEDNGNQVTRFADWIKTKNDEK